MVGQRDRLDPGSFLHAVYTSLGGSETILYTWNYARGMLHLFKHTGTVYDLFWLLLYTVEPCVASEADIPVCISTVIITSKQL